MEALVDPSEMKRPRCAPCDLNQSLVSDSVGGAGFPELPQARLSLRETEARGGAGALGTWPGAGRSCGWGQTCHANQLSGLNEPVIGDSLDRKGGEPIPSQGTLGKMSDLGGWRGQWGRGLPMPKRACCPPALEDAAGHFGHTRC